MRIDNSGNVGIGTTNPASKLEVNGVIASSLGTVGAPSFSFAGDLDTGMWSSGVNTVNFSTGSYERLRIDSSGNVGIGTTNPGYLLQVGNAGDGSEARANAWNTLSDISLKTNIATVSGALEKILRLEPVAFDWQTSGKPSLGFIAQAVAQIFPELVSTGDDGLKSLNYGGLTAPIVSAIQELAGQVNNLLHPQQIISPWVETDTLVAKQIESPTINSILDKIQNLSSAYEEQTATAAAEASASAEILARLQEKIEASPSANLDIDSVSADFGFFQDYLAVMGEATITSLKVTDTLSVARITSPVNTLDFLAGMMVMDKTSGTVTINAQVKVLGHLSAPSAGFDELVTKKLEAEEAKIGQLTTEGLTIALPLEASAAAEASNSASIATNATAGKSVLPAGASEFTIYTPHVTANDLVYVTPLADTQNQVLYVKAKQEGEWFKVALNQPLPVDLPFNWWIIKLE